MLKMGGYGNQWTSCICLVHMWLEICKPESPAGSDKVLEQAAASKEGKFESRNSNFFRASFPGGAIRSWLALTIGQSQNLCFCTVDCRRFSAHVSLGGAIYLESCPPALLLSVKQAALLHLPVDSNTVRWYFFKGKKGKKGKNRLLTSSSASITRLSCFLPAIIILFPSSRPRRSLPRDTFATFFNFSFIPGTHAREDWPCIIPSFFRLFSFALFYLSGVLRARARVSFSFGKNFGVRRQRDPILLSSHVLTNETSLSFLFPSFPFKASHPEKTAHYRTIPSFTTRSLSNTTHPINNVCEFPSLEPVTGRNSFTAKLTERIVRAARCIDVNVTPSRR